MSDISMEPLSPTSTPQFLHAFFEDSLVIDLLNIELLQLDESQPETYTGKGFLRIFRDRNFEFRMYADSNQHHGEYFTRAWKRLEARKPGQQIARNEYFQLAGTDINGNKWCSEQVKVNPSTTSQGTVIVGTLYAPLIHKRSDLPQAQRASIKLYFFNELPLYFSGVAHTQTTENGRPVRSILEENHANFSSSNYDFSVRKVEPKSGSTILLATSSSPSLHAAIELRIEEALSYVTASKVRWCLCEKRHGTSRELTITPRSDVDRSFLGPPVPHDGQTATDFWQLFDAYFKFVISHPDEDEYHPLSLQLYHVINGTARDLSLIALLLCVAVEGVLKTCFADLAKPSQTFVDSLEQVKKLIRRIKCLDDRLKARIVGSVDAMNQSRANDKLKLLIQLGTITRKQTDTWQGLRNASAHADKNFAPEKAQELSSSCHAVYTMLHQLVFQAIGYSGQHVNYGTTGWPVENFHAKAPQ